MQLKANLLCFLIEEEEEEEKKENNIKYLCECDISQLATVLNKF